MVVLKPMAQANRLSDMLNKVLGRERFPVAVEALALEYSRQCFADSPIDKIHGDHLDGFEGLLKANKARTKWLILFNSAVRSEGRKRFTIAHEFGHYLLHRHLQSEFACGDAIEAGGASVQDIEAEANKFASTLLMPFDDLRRQVEGQSISFDLLAHCADRYGVSLTAAALGWIEIAPKRAVLVASRDDHLLWAKSNADAFKSGAYFATRQRTIALPDDALAHSRNCKAFKQCRITQAQRWFPREPASMPLTEITQIVRQHEYTLTLLLMPDAEWNGYFWPQRRRT